MAFSRPKKHGSVQVPAPATVGGITEGDWTYLDPTTQANSISASTGSGTALSLDSTAFNSGTKKITVVYSGSHDDSGSPSGVNNDIDTTIVWTWNATDIFGDQMRYGYPMVAIWSLELTKGPPFGTTGSMRMTQIMAGLTNTAASQGNPYSSTAQMMLTGVRTNDAETSVWQRFSKGSAYVETGNNALVYRHIGWYSAKIDATGRMVGSAMKTTSTSDPTALNFNISHYDAIHTFSAEDIHFCLAIGRHGANSRVTEETVEIKLKVAAMRLGTTW